MSGSETVAIPTRAPGLAPTSSVAGGPLTTSDVRDGIEKDNVVIAEELVMSQGESVPRPVPTRNNESISREHVQGSVLGSQCDCRPQMREASPPLVDGVPRDLEDLIERGDCLRRNSSIVTLHDGNVSKPTFLRRSLTFKGLLTGAAVPNIRLAWLTISSGTIEFQDIHFACKIQVTAKAKLRAKNCIFEPYDDKTEAAVEIFAKSQGEFA